MLHPKFEVRAASTGELPLEGLRRVDGVDLKAGDPVLVKNQPQGSQNGLYTAAEGDWSRVTNIVWEQGARLRVREGTSCGSTDWVLTTLDPSEGADLVFARTVWDF